MEKEEGHDETPNKDYLNALPEKNRIIRGPIWKL
jgi:hypothetical protein